MACTVAKDNRAHVEGTVKLENVWRVMIVVIPVYTVYQINIFTFLEGVSTVFPTIIFTFSHFLRAIVLIIRRDFQFELMKICCVT